MDPNMPQKPLDEWEDIHEKFYKKYSRLGKWQNENLKLVSRQGYYTSFTGRRYVFIPDGGKYSKPSVCNYIVQGTATGDIVPFAMMVIRKKIKDGGLDANIVCQVHDSVVLDVLERDVDAVAHIVWSTFNELPVLIKQYFRYDWITPLTGEVECGPNYKEQEKIYGQAGKIAV